MWVILVVGRRFCRSDETAREVIGGVLPSGGLREKLSKSG
jgi:hypothetical protein